MKRIALNLAPVTTEFVIAHEMGEYNPVSWKQKVLSYASYTGSQFYCSGEGDSTRFFVLYTLEDGTRLFSPFTFSSSLSNNGFSLITLDDTCITVTGFGESGTQVVKNTPAGRSWMATASKTKSLIFSNQF